jgi:ubiquinone/menaquinone biosynthesis C-methylase UbiE
MLAPFPRETDLEAFYPPLYGFTPEVAAEQGGLKSWVGRLQNRLFFQPQYSMQAQAVVSVTGSGTGRRLLDVGCGMGLRLIELRKQGFEVEGVDFQPAVVEYLQKQLGIPAVCSGAGKLDQVFRPESFDVITAFYVLEHVPDVHKVLESCWRLLRPGGWLVAAIPVVDGIHYRLFKSRSKCVVEAPRHLSLPSQKGIKNLYDKIGYDRIVIKPDSVLMCAGVMALSLFPQASTTHFYRASRFRALFATVLGTAALSVSVPWCLVENYVFRQPAIALVFGRKPAGGRIRSSKNE